MSAVCLHFRAVVVIVVAVPERAKCFSPKFRQFQPIGYLFCRHWAFDPCYCTYQVANSKGIIWSAHRDIRIIYLWVSPKITSFLTLTYEAQVNKMRNNRISCPGCLGHYNLHFSHCCNLIAQFFLFFIFGGGHCP